MPSKTIDEVRALVDPEGYVRAMREVLETYKGNLTRLLVDHDLMAEDQTLTDEQRQAAQKRTEQLMRSTVWRMKKLEEKIQGVKEAPPLGP